MWSRKDARRGVPAEASRGVSALSPLPMPPGILRLARRPALAAAAGAAVMPWLAGCAGGGAAADRARGSGPAPAATSTRITLTFQPYTDAYGFPDHATLNAILAQATQPFLDSHPGVDLAMYGTTVNPLAAVIAGTGPDVPQLQGGGGGISAWLAGPFLVELTPYIKKSNVNMSNFAAGQVADVTTPQGIYGIPNYTGTSGVAVNETALDDLGLTYPSPNWTYTEWAKLAESASGVQKGKRRFGTTIDADYFGSGPGALYYVGWGASIVDPQDPSRCGLDQPQAVACAEFLYNLVWENAAQFGWVPNNFIQGLTVAPFCWLQSYIIPAATQWKSFKWDFWPMPAFPQGSFAMTNPNFFAISVNTKQPDLAWELVEWLTVQPDWQRILMRAVLLPPGYLPLWDEWTTVVKQVAPTLASKNLDVFAQHVHSGIMYGGTHFAYSDPQAKSLLQGWYTKILNRTVTVQEGLAQCAQQIDTLQVTAAAEAGGRRQAAQQFPTAGPAMAPAAPGV